MSLGSRRVQTAKKDITSLAYMQTSWALHDGMAFLFSVLLVRLNAGIASSLDCMCVKVRGPVSLHVLTFVVGGRSGPLPAIPEGVD